MKKLFVLFLLAVLVPFSVGCNLWSYDDPDPVATSKLSLSKVLPAGSLAGNIRGAAVSLNYADLFMELVFGGVTYKLPCISAVNTTAGVVVTFSQPIPTTTFTALKGAAPTVEIKIQPAGSTAIATVVPAAVFNLPNNIVSNSTVADPVVVTTVVSLATIESALKALDTTLTVASYNVTSIKNGSTELGTTAAAATVLAPATTYTFVVTLDQTYTNTAAPTWTVAVANTAATTAKTISSTGNPSYVTVTPSNDKKTLTVVVTPSTTDANYQLKAGQTYSITLSATDAVYGTVKPTLPAARYIKIQ